MVIYNNGKIYKIEPIVDHDDEDIYIGSTTKQYLSQRMDTIRSDYKTFKKYPSQNQKVACYDIFDEYGVDNCQIVLIEEYVASSKDDLDSRKIYHVNKMKCINKIVYDKSRKEYEEKNKDIIKLKQQEYRDNNKDKLNKKYKKYYEENKEKIQVKDQKYRAQVYLCECGCKITIGSKLKHLKSQKHKNKLEIQV